MADAFPDSYLTDEAAIAGNVEELPSPSAVECRYRCLICSQIWVTPLVGRGIFKEGHRLTGGGLGTDG